MDRKKSLFEQVNELCLKIYGKPHQEVFDYGEFTDEELDEQKEMLLKKKRIMDKFQPEKINGTKVPEESKDFFDTWRKLWDMRIESQPIMREIYALVALSQVFRDIHIFRGGIEEDIRIHSTVIMPSGTGKSEGNDFLYQFSSRVNKKYYSIERFTDAILTGSIKRNVMDRNVAKGYKEGDEGYRDPYSPSVLTVNDYVVSDEGESILKSTKATEGAQRLLQKAMNRFGSEGNILTNNLIDGSVEARPNCSIAITSYYLDDFRETLLHRGLLQRMVVYIQDENEDRRTKIINRIIGDIASFKDNKEEAFKSIDEKKERMEKLYADLVSETSRLKNLHSETKYVLMHESAKTVMADSIKELRNLMPMLVGQKQIWESMISRLTVNILKISAIYALAAGRDFISAEDAQKASALMLETMRSVAFFLKDNVQTRMDSKAIRIYNSLKSKFVGFMKKEEEWKAVIMEQYGFSEPNANTLIKNFIDSGKFEKRIDGTYILK